MPKKRAKTNKIVLPRSVPADPSGTTAAGQAVLPSAPPALPARVIKTAGYRVPKDAPPEVAAIADRALQRYVDVMDERVEPMMAGHVLRAAEKVREEVCGPVPKEVKISGKLTLAQLIAEAEEQEKQEGSIPKMVQQPKTVVLPPLPPEPPSAA